MSNIQCILNELSLSDQASDKERARAMMESFVDVLKGIEKNAVSPQIRLHTRLWQIELCPGYTVHNWSDDLAINKDKRIYFKIKVMKFPLLEELEKSMPEDCLETDVLHENVSGKGLTVAYLTENPVISLNSNSKWVPSELDVLVRKLKNDGSAEINFLDVEGSLLNFSTDENLKLNIDKLIQLARDKFKSVEDFWNHKEKIFPKIEFAPSFKDDLNGIGFNNLLFDQIISSLSRLNDYCNNWSDGPCRICQDLPNVSGESASTMQQFGSERVFKDELGKDVTCEIHSRLTPGAVRLHFCPLESQKKIFVGYVGPKLSSVLY